MIFLESVGAGVDGSDAAGDGAVFLPPSTDGGRTAVGLPVVSGPAEGGADVEEDAGVTESPRPDMRSKILWSGARILDVGCESSL